MPIRTRADARADPVPRAQGAAGSTAATQGRPIRAATAEEEIALTEGGMAATEGTAGSSFP